MASGFERLFRDSTAVDAIATLKIGSRPAPAEQRRPQRVEGIHLTIKDITAGLRNSG